MKRLMMFIFVLAILLLPMLLQAESFLYSARVSTLTVGPLQEGLNVAGINLSSVKVKNIIIHQTGTTAQIVTLYKSYTSTKTATALATFSVPGVVGEYYPLGQFAPSTSGGNQDIINVPYLAVRTSTDVVANSCYITVIYAK
jgi:hypothetical protein